MYGNFLGHVVWQSLVGNHEVKPKTDTSRYKTDIRLILIYANPV